MTHSPLGLQVLAECISSSHTLCLGPKVWAWMPFLWGALSDLLKLLSVLVFFLPYEESRREKALQAECSASSYITE